MKEITNIKQLKKEYNNEVSENDIVSHLLNAEEDIKNGRVRCAKEVFKEWKDKYGI